MANSKLKLHREERKDNREAHENKLQKELDVFGVKLIKMIGWSGAIIGLIILVLFWTWVFKKMF